MKGRKPGKGLRCVRTVQPQMPFRLEFLKQLNTHTHPL